MGEWNLQYKKRSGSTCNACVRARVRAREWARERDAHVWPQKRKTNFFSRASETTLFAVDYLTFIINTNENSL